MMRGDDSRCFPIMLVVFLLLLSFSEAASGGVAGGESTLEIKELVVPEYVERGENVELKCNWSASGDIYSVKWYFNDKELLTYKPSESQVFSYPIVYGVKVGRQSTTMKLYLEEVQLAATGNYKCEVITEWPTFLTADASSNLTVVELPEEKPTITGTQHQYRIGDEANLTCSSPRSFPAAELTWYINDDPAPKEFLVFRNTTEHPAGLKESHLGLRFVVTLQHFHQGEMTLRCTARISPLYLKTQQHSVDGQVTYNVPPMESRTKAAMSGGSSGGGVGVMAKVMAVLLVVTLLTSPQR